MSKAVLISIRPKWCEKIINGQKTVEVRKTRPKMDTPFKCYIYCAAGRPYLNIPISNERLMRDYLETGSMKSMTCPLGNGKVIGEFTCNRVTNLFSNSRFWLDDDDVLHTCLSAAEMRKYANGANGLYGWHISNLKIYDTTRELREFYAGPDDIRDPVMDERKITVELRPDQLADIIDAVLAFADDCANDREILQSMPRVDRDTVEDLLQRETALQTLAAWLQHVQEEAE